MKALNAVDEPKNMQPMMNTTVLLAISAQTGTPRDEWMLPIHGDPMSALSLAKDHVKRDAVCWTAMRATTAAVRSMHMKTVAAALERVAWYQIS